MSPDGHDSSHGLLSPEERRRFVRVRREVSLAVRIVGSPSPAETANSRNVSAGGLLLSARSPLPVGARLQIIAKIEASGIEFSMGGRVVWTEFNSSVNRHESGVCFVGLDPTQRNNVAALIGSHVPHSEGLERRHFIRLAKRLVLEYRMGPPLLRRWRPTSTHDISADGIAIASEKPVHTGTAVAMKIYLDEPGGERIETRGVVVGCSHREGAHGVWTVHIQFNQDESDARRRLGAYISRNLAGIAVEGLTTPRPGDEGEGATPPNVT